MDTRWRIELLGRLRARYGLGEIARFPRPKAGELLAYLAYYPRRSHSREALIEVLWPEIDPELGRNALRKLLHWLRQQVEVLGGDAEHLIVADRSSVSLRPEAFITDVGEFTAALAAARAAPPGQQAARLAEAVARYGGELLPDSFESWVLTEREALRGQYLDSLHQLVPALEGAGDLTGALQGARQAVAADPLREEAHYDLMRLLAATGQPSACLCQYQELERLLREELDETPSAEARALAEELRRHARTLVVARRAPRPEGERGRGGEGQTDPLSPAPAAPSPLPQVFPSPALPLPPTPLLPVQSTRFFGRQEEITRLTALLASPVTRLVTLTGPGGSGKTRLAIAVAGRLQELFGAGDQRGAIRPPGGHPEASSGGLAFVPLADVTEARQIPAAVAVALGLAPAADREPLEQVVAHLRGQPWLLVLDNCEHLVEAGALLVRTLLDQIPTLTCLATSRQSLGLSGEQEFALLPLPTPRRSEALEQLRDYASVQLFVDRARATHAGFQLTEANAAAVGELCDRLEGLPLALELAAARAGVLAPQQMLAQLAERFQFLVSRQRDVPLRHRTLRAALDGSYQLLAPELRRFFARLSVFRGGFTLEAVTAVCGDFGFWILDFGLAPTKSSDRPEPLTLPAIQNPKSKIQNSLDCLQQLRDCSLIQVEEGREEVRYRLLETLREYAGEQLGASGKLVEYRKRHRDWYLRFAEQVEAAADRLEQKGWLTRLEAELDNLRAALAYCQEEADADPEGFGAEAGLRLAVALGRLWETRGYFTEGLQWLEGALARGSALRASLRAPALRCAAHLNNSRGDPSRARTLLQAARCEYEQALALARAEGNRSAVAWTLQSLAEIIALDSEPGATWPYCVEARQLFEELGEAVGLARSLETMATDALRRGDRRASWTLREECLALRRERGDSLGLVHALGGLGHLARDEGDYGRARAFYHESLVLRRELGLLLAIAQSLEDLAVLAGRQRQTDRAIRILGAAEAFCETLGARPPVAFAAEYERTVAEGRAALGEAAFAAAWAEGRALSLDAAVAYALGESDRVTEAS